MPQEALSVSAALALAKGALEAVTIRVVGEVCELNDKPGYKAVYFSVKDENAVLNCQMWLNRYNANGLRFRLGDVLELTGRFTLYAAKGRMSFDVFSFVPVGEGNLRLRVAQLAKKLEGEGLMDPARKRRPRAFPETVGVVTSPRGDAVHDVFRTLRRRFPLTRVLFAGVPVEGVNAPSYIMDGIRCVVDAGAEVVLVVRGGGSYEDLMPYNDERLARAIAACPVPVVTGIGHEPDTTIADMVADVRASTPTAAAEAVSPSPEELAALIGQRQHRLDAGMTRELERLQHQVALRAGKRVFAEPTRLYEAEALHLDAALASFERLQDNLLAADARNLGRAGERMVALSRAIARPFAQDLALKASRLQDLSPLNVLSRGYAIVRDGAGKPVTSVKATAPGASLRVNLSDGDIDAIVQSVHPRE